MGVTDGLNQKPQPLPPTSLSLCAQGPRQKDLTASYKYVNFVHTCWELGRGSLLLLCRVLNIDRDQRRTGQMVGNSTRHCISLLSTTVTMHPPPRSFSSYSQGGYHEPENYSRKTRGKVSALLRFMFWSEKQTKQQNTYIRQLQFMLGRKYLGQ